MAAEKDIIAGIAFQVSLEGADKVEQQVAALPEKLRDKAKINLSVGLDTKAALSEANDLIAEIESLMGGGGTGGGRRGGGRGSGGAGGDWSKHDRSKKSSGFRAGEWRAHLGHRPGGGAGEEDAMQGGTYEDNQKLAQIEGVLRKKSAYYSNLAAMGFQPEQIDEGWKLKSARMRELEQHRMELGYKPEPRPEKEPKPVKTDEQLAAEKKEAEVHSAKIGWMSKGLSAQEALNRSLKDYEDKAKKAVEPTSWIAKAWDTIGAGGIRRGVAQLTTGGLEGMLGEGSKVAAAGGAMTGALVSSLALPIAWALGNAVMGLPGKIMGEREQSAIFGAGARSPQERNELNALWIKNSVKWAGSAGGEEEFHKVAAIFQDTRFHGRRMTHDEIDEWSNRVMRIGIAGGKTAPSALAQSTAKVFTYRSMEGKQALLGDQWILDEAIRQSSAASATKNPEWQVKRIGELYSSRVRGTDNLIEAMKSAENRFPLEARENAAQESGSGVIRRGISEAYQTIAHPVDSYNAANTPAAKSFGEDVAESYKSARKRQDDELGWWDRSKGYLGEDFNRIIDEELSKRHIRRVRGWFNDDFERMIPNADADTNPVSGQPGLQSSASGFTPNRSEEFTSQYQWTSFSGLAEQMQMMWSGAPADALVNSNDNLRVSIDGLTNTIRGGKADVNVDQAGHAAAPKK